MRQIFMGMQPGVPIGLGGRDAAALAGMLGASVPSGGGVRITRLPGQGGGGVPGFPSPRGA